MRLVLGVLAVIGVFGLLLGFSFSQFELPMDVPKGFPEISYPEGNEPSPERIALGKALFFDPVLSKDFTVSCASCHKPHLGFSDSQKFSIGADLALGKSNAPTLTNVAYSPYLNRDGGVPTLEMQVLVPIQEHVELDMNILEIAERLNRDSIYVQMSRAAYDRVPDAFVITRALACYERTLISGNSRFDKYYYQNDKSQLTRTERKGMKLFFSEKAQCSTCHSGFTFTNYAFENNGLYVEYPDSGRIRLTREEADRALFKVPTLRNLELTAPYMHDGSLETIEDVIEHYSTGVATHKHLSKNIKKFDFSSKEKEQLVAFLKSLTDEEFITKHTVK
ncbi:MAG: cytochrome-c peroxidase [Flavobacteriales bacterium]